MTQNFAVLGGGPMGLILSSKLAPRCERISLWHPDKAVAEDLNRTHTTFLLDKPWSLPLNVTITSDLDPFARGDWTIFVAVSSRLFEETMDLVMERLSPGGEHTIACFTKGLCSSQVRKKSNLVTLGDYVENLIQTKNRVNTRLAHINGPSLLMELAIDNYTFLNIGCTDPLRADFLKALFSSQHVAVRTTDDRPGMELGGILKNPIAIACGIVQGLPNAADNLQGELLARGFRELFELGTKLGARPETLFGRSGLADMIGTGISSHSRNRTYGVRFVEDILTGENTPSLKDKIQMRINPAAIIEKQVRQNPHLVEGVHALSSILELAREHNTDLPLYRAIFDVLSRKSHPHTLAAICGIPQSEGKVLRNQANEKQAGMEFVKGRNFKVALQHRIFHQIRVQPGMTNRIQRQSKQILPSLEKRLTKSRRTGNKRDLKFMPREIELWRQFGESNHDLHNHFLQELIDFYIDEIADEFKIGMRETLIRVLAPARFMAGGLKPGSGVPYVGGQLKEVKSMASRYNVLYAPTHRSHLDSLEIGFGLKMSGLPVPRYAAGINLMANPTWGWVLKSLGAYTVDREKTRNILYLECLTNYSVFLLESGIPSLVYPEGTRSRTGGFQPLKTGLLSTAVDAYRSTGREVIIVPISLSYENIPEDLEFVNKGSRLNFNDFINKRSRVYMDLGKPIRVSKHFKGSDPLMSIGHKIAREWRLRMRILPNQLLAKILIDQGGEVSMNSLEGLVQDHLNFHPGNYLTSNVTKIIKRGVKTLNKRGFADVEGGVLRARETELLTYYATMIPDLNETG